MSGRRRLALVAAAAGIALAGFFMARRAGVGWRSSAGTGTAPSVAPVSAEVAPGAAPAVHARLAPLPMAPPSLPSGSPPDTSPAALTTVGAARALQAIGKDPQTQQLFMRLQRVGLSPEQRDRVLLILGTQALLPSRESPTLEALRAGGSSRVLSDDEANRVRDERRQISERALRALRPALAAVLTPSQLARAGLGGDTAAAGKRDGG